MNYMSLKDHVYKYISDKIRDGSIKPNDKINEQQLCEELNMSRTPIREALIQLSTEGILDYEPRRGFWIRPLSLKDVTDLYQLIGDLDAMAACLALYNMTETDIQSMRNLQVAMTMAIKNETYDEYYKLQIEYHNIYLNKCDNKQLIETLALLKKKFIRQGYSGKGQENRLIEAFSETNRQHDIIINLFESKDVQKLEAYLKEVHWSIDYAVLDVL